MSNTTSAGTNGYVIRLEVLKMAKEMAEQDYYSSRDALRQTWEAKVSFAQQKASTLGFQNVEFPSEPTYPTFPTPEVIKTKANELYQFITTKW